MDRARAASPAPAAGRLIVEKAGRVALTVMMSAEATDHVVAMTVRAAASTETTRAGDRVPSVATARRIGGMKVVVRPTGGKRVAVRHTTVTEAIAPRTGAKAGIVRNALNAETVPRASVRRTGVKVETVRSALSAETGRIVANVQHIVDRMETAPAIPSAVTALSGRTALIARLTGVRKADVLPTAGMKETARAALSVVTGRSAATAPGRRGVNIHRAVRTGASVMTTARVATSAAARRRTSCPRR